MIFLILSFFHLIAQACHLHRLRKYDSFLFFCTIHRHMRSRPFWDMTLGQGSCVSSCMKCLNLKLFGLNGFGCSRLVMNGYYRRFLGFSMPIFFQFIVSEMLVWFNYFWQSFYVYCFESCCFFFFFLEVETLHLSYFKIRNHLDYLLHKADLN